MNGDGSSESILTDTNVEFGFCYDEGVKERLEEIKQQFEREGCPVYSDVPESSDEDNDENASGTESIVLSENDEDDSDSECSRNQKEIKQLKDEFDKACKRHSNNEVPLLRTVHKPEFTQLERKIMIYYLIIQNDISSGKGLRIWRDLISSGILTHRTEQSIQNHFIKFILPTIHNYDISQRFKKEFEKLKIHKKRNTFN